MLARLQKLRSDNEDGFTLIELLIVVVIIGILASIAIPIFLNQQKAAMVATVKSDVRNSVTVVATYLATNPQMKDMFTNIPEAKLVTSTGNRVVVSGQYSTATGSYSTTTGQGTWESYYVIGWNPNLGAAKGYTNESAYWFSSSTGTYNGTGVFA